MTFDLASTPLVSLEEGVLTLPISSTGPGNPLDGEALGQCLEAVRALRSGDLDAGAVLLVGPGKNFCAGGDVAGFAAAEDRGTHVYDLAELLHTVIREFDALDVPVVAAVRGWAAGAGLSLVLAADVSVGGPGTHVLPAYPGIGLTPDGGMSWRLPRAIGQSAARTFLLCNEPVDGARALQLGLLTRLVAEDDSVVEEARALAVRLAAGPRQALGAAKRLLRDSETTTLDAQLDAERDSISELASSPDGREGVDAFVAKRTPHFG